MRTTPANLSVEGFLDRVRVGGEQRLERVVGRYLSPTKQRHETHADAASRLWSNAQDEFMLAVTPNLTAAATQLGVEMFEYGGDVRAGELGRGTALQVLAAASTPGLALLGVIGDAAEVVVAGTASAFHGASALVQVIESKFE